LNFYLVEIFLMFQSMLLEEPEKMELSEMKLTETKKWEQRVKVKKEEILLLSTI
jgi:hypothetical protein